MNAPVLVAQLSGSAPQSSAPPKNLKLEKPQNGQAVTIHLDGNTKLDLSDISSEKLTFVRVGEKLIVLFDNQSTVTVDPVFDSGGHPLADVAFDLGQNRLVTGDEFATLFPITTDQSVLPAAGANSGPTGGANFSDAHVNALTDPNAPLALLGDENNGSQFGSQAQDGGNAPVASEPFSNAGLNESHLPGGTAVDAGLTTISGFLGVNFGTAASSAVLSFNEGQGSLAALRSGGEQVNFVRVADAAGHFTQLIGFVGADPSIVANRVFVATLDATAESGGYTITLLGPLDHSGAGDDTLSFALNVTAADQFGSAQTQITANVQDDIVVLSGDVAAQGVSEDGLAGANGFAANAGSTGAVDLNINWGADNDLRGTSEGDGFGRTLSFLTSNGSEENPTFTAVTGSDQQVINLALAIAGENGAALSSGGIELQYVVTSLADGGEVLTAYKGDARGDNARVFTLTLDPTSAHGAYSFNLLGTLDHATGSDSVGLTFRVQAADADGDIVNTSFTVNVADDAPVTAGEVVAHNVSEDGLAGANGFTAGAGSTGAVDLNINWGTDNDTRGEGDTFGRTLSFVAGGVPAITGENGAALSSGGIELQYVVTSLPDGGEVLTAYKGDARGDDARVFALTLDPTSAHGAYSVNLLGTLDHATGSDSVGLIFTVQAADADGDIVNTSFTVNVADDLPVTSGAAVGATNLSEDGLAGANPDQGHASAASGPVALNIDWGTDNDTRGEGDTFGRTLSFVAGVIPAITGENGVELSSGGVALQYLVTTLPNGGELLTAYKGAPGENNAVFTLTLDPTSEHGAYSFNLLGTLDHGASSDSIGLTFTVQAADADGDTVNTSFTVNVADDLPVTSGAAVGATDLSEDGLAGANPDQGHAPAVSGQVALNIDWGTDNDTRGNGEGDTFGRTLSFLSGSGSEGDSTLTPLPGSDQPVAYLAFAVTGENGGLLSSGGVALQYIVTALANGGELLTAYKGDARGDDARVFTVTLDPTSEHGSYSFNLLGTLDHAKGSDSISLSFGVQAADADGDTANTSFTVNVADDLPVTVGKVGDQTVGEDGLHGANPTGGSFDAVDNTAVPTEGSSVALNINWGTDSDTRGNSAGDTFGRTLSFLSGNGSQEGEESATLTALTGSNQPVINLALAITGENGAVLSSGGVELQYVVTPLPNGGETLTAYKGAPSEDNSNIVFTLTLDPTQPRGGYNFNLLGALDHATNSDSIGLTFTVQAADADGDTVNTSFTVNVIDDVPVIGTPVAAQIVGEDRLGGANQTGGSYDAANNASVNGVVLNVNWGADNDIHTGASDLVGRTLFFNMVGEMPVDGSGHALALSSDGVPLQYVVTAQANGGEMLQAYRGGTHDASTLVFTVTLDPTSAHGSYSFVLSGNLDHATSGALGDELPVDFGLTATDSDGDTVGTHFMVKVQDDVPVVGTAGMANVNEDDLPNGNDLPKETRTVHGDLAIGWGADDGAARHILMATGGLPAGLTSDGVGIDYQTTVDADGNAVVMAYKHGGSAANAADQVFSLSFNESGSGTYTFKLLGNLDHAEGSDDRALQFTVDAYDSDGDSAAQSFTVHVADDHPIAVGTILPRYVEEEELSGGNEDRNGAGDGDSIIFGDLTTDHASGLLNIFWGGDDSNKNVDGGYSGTQVAGDRSVVFGGTGGGHIDDGAVDANVASQFLSVSGGHGGIGLAGLTSGGEHLVYTLSQHGMVLTATTESGKPVFTVTLSDQGLLGGGGYDFQLQGVLDHPVQTSNGPAGEDTLSFNFTFTARDGDGDIAQNHFTVNVIDDVPVAGTGTGSSVEDEALSRGNNESDGLSASVHGVSLNILWGADNGNSNAGGNGDRSVAFSNADVAVSGAYDGTVLTSGGKDVHFALLSDGHLVGYTGSSAPHSIGAGNVVFYASVSDIDNGKYDFTLVKSLDHANNGLNNENELTLTFNYTATDSDGDTSSNTFTVAVVDDVATLANANIAGGFVEEEQDSVAGPGNEDFGGTNDADSGVTVFGLPVVLNDATTAKASGSLGINWGADNVNDHNGQPGDRSVQFVNVADPANLTSRGEVVHYAVLTSSSGQPTLVAYTGGSVPGSVPTTTDAAVAAHVVFTVALSDTSAHGSYGFTLFDVLDQHGAGEDTLSLSFQFTATDSDGDTTAPGTLTVGVIDDTPVALGTIAPRFVEEEELPGGNEDRKGSGDGDSIIFGDLTTAHAGGPLNIFWGGDDSNKNVDGGYNGTQVNGDRSVVFGGTDGAYIADGTPGHLTLAPGAVSQFLSVSGGGMTLADLTSGGAALSYVLSNHGTTLTAYAGDPSLGLKVFTVTLSDQGPLGGGGYDFQLQGVLDHPVHTSNGPAGEDTVSFNFTFTARDGDGDIVQSGFTVNVIDDVPVIGTPQAGSVAEVGHVAELINGSFEANSLASGTPGVIVDARGNYTYGAPTGWTITGGNGGLFAPTAAISDSSQHSGGNVVWLREGAMLAQNTGTMLVAGDVYTLHFNVGDRTDQSYPGGTVRLIAFNGIDSVVLQTLELPTPADGQWAAVNLSTGQIDGAYAGYQLRVEIQQTGGTGNQILIDNVEMDHFAPTVATGGLDIHWGADGANALHPVAFNGLPDATGLSSNGEALHYVLSSNDTVLTAVSADGRAIFTVSLSDAGTGSYTFTLLDNLDHQGANGASLPLNFSLIATDGDGDTTVSNLHIAVDDQALSIIPVAVGELSEVTINSPSSNAFVPQTISDHSLGIDWGADNANPGLGTIDRNVVLTTTVAPAGLTSNGYDLQYVLSADGKTLTAYRVMQGVSLQEPHVAETHYVSANGGDLLADLTPYVADHAKVFSVQLSDVGNGNYSFTLFDNLDHLGSNDTSLPLHFSFDATDGDGDVKLGSFEVDVRDTVPTLGMADSVTVSEAVLATGVHAVTGNLGVDWNADEGAAKHIAFISQPTGLKSDGVDVDYRIVADGDNQLLIAYKSGDPNYTPVFTVSFTEANPSYTFALFQNLDHAPGGDPLNLSFVVRATDSDGDHVDQTFKVDVTDSVPSIVGGDRDFTLDEDDLPGGNDALMPDTHQHDQTVLANKSLGIQWGADDGPARDVTLLSSTAPAGLKAGGLDVHYSLSADGHTLIAYTGSNSADPSSQVFTVSLDPTQPNGAYTFKLLHSLDHAPGDGENSLALNFAFRAKDSDTDPVDSSFVIRVTDDVPVVDGTATSTNFLTNGDFSGGTFAHQEGWGQWATEDTGWSVQGTVAGQTGVRLERIANHYLNMETSDGHPMVDLGATPGNVQISQTISGLAAGQHFTLSFEVGSPSPSSAGLEIYWNNQLIPVETLSPTGTMTLHTLNLVAAAGDNVLTFKEIGNPNDNTGTYLANISLTEASGSTQPVFHADAQENGTQIFDLGMDFHFGADGAGAVAFDTAHATISSPTGTTLGMPTLSYDLATGALTMNPGTAFDALSQGEIATLSVPFTVTDADGDVKTGVYQFTITGTNDAPVIAGGDVSGAVNEAGDLPQIVEAGVGSALHLSAALAANSVVTDALDTLDGHLPAPPTPPASVPVGITQADIQAAIVAIDGVAGVDTGTAIAVVWQHMNGFYATHGANDTNLNAAFLYLGLEYASYVAQGGSPLVDVTAKYADGNGDGVPERLQSLHDNLLGNLTDAALHQRYDSTADLYQTMHNLVATQDATLLVRTYAEGTNPSETAVAHAFDLTHDYATQAHGQLSAHDVDATDVLTWSGTGLTGAYGTFAIDAASGKWTFTLDDTLAQTQQLGAGQSDTQAFTAMVSDGHGGSATQVVTVTINGTNDAPVITSTAAQSHVTLHEGGRLDHVTTADVASDYKFHFDVAAGSPDRMDPVLDSQIGTLLSQHPTDMQAVLAGVEGLLGHPAGMADAIAAVWTYIDSHYTAYYDNAINAAGVRLAIAYAEYIKVGGGEPLTDVIVKYAPDGADVGTALDRVQSMHDNILGNLDQPSMQDKFLSGTNPDHALYVQLEAEIAAAGLPLGRPVYSGNESGIQSDPAPSIAWDEANGLLPGGTHQAASGQLTATDVDANDAGLLTWSGDANGTYGTFAIAADGKWTYTLDNSRAETQALAANETHAETFVATVSDDHGSSASQIVTVTIVGTNDAPVIGAGTVVVNGNFEAGTSYQTVNAPEGSYSNGSPQGWTVFGPTYGGWFAPNDTSLPDAQGAHGNNVLWLNDGQTATQIVGTAAVGHYELSIDVGDRIDANLTGLPAYSISLYAGSTLVATHVTTATHTDGPAWTTVTLGADIDAVLAGQGQQLSIRLENLETQGSAGDFTQQVQINFDNVKLDFVSAQSLPTVTEDAIDNGGQAVASILGTSVTDVDHGAVQGIAIIGDNAGNGTWQYFDAGHWVNFGTYSTTSALLLTADDVVRFVPNGAHGTTASFDYVAWDQTSGTTHATADVTTRGGSTAFSTATGHAVIDVTDINDAPTDIALDNLIVPAGAAGGTVIGNVTVMDPDGDTQFTFAVQNPDGSVNPSFVVGGTPGHYQLMVTDAGGPTSLPPAVVIVATDPHGASYSEPFALMLPVALYDTGHQLIGTYGSITDADGAAQANYKIVILGTITNEHATLTRDGLTVEGQADDTGIVLTLDAGVKTLTLGGDAPFDVNGNSLDNVIYGNEGANVITGGDGSDVIFGGGNNDRLDGGAGDNLLVGDYGTHNFNGELYSMANVLGSDGNDTLSGTSGSDIFDGGGGNDTFVLQTGGTGDNNGFDQYDGGDGYDVIKGGWSYDVLHVTNNLSNLNGIEEINGGDGQPGYNTIVATGGNDTLDFSSSGKNIKLVDFMIDGGAGNDIIKGYEGTKNYITGGAGNDTLTGGNLDDTFYLVTGGNGDNNGIDQYNGGDGHDKIVGGWAYDVLRVTNNLSNLNSIEELDGGGSENTILATAANDTLDFSSMIVNNFTIDGGAGHDSITGTSGNDTIRGNTGNDTLDGRDGSDTYLVGQGDGFDRFNDTGNVADHDRIVVTASNVNAGITTIAGIEEIDATGKSNVKVVGDASNQTLDFSSVELKNIVEVDGGAGHDVIIASAVSGDGQNYRGNSGNDTLNANGQTVNWLYSGSDNGNDVLTGNGTGTVKAIAQDSQVVFGIQNYNNGVDEFVGDAGKTLIRADAANNTLDFSQTVLTNIGEVDGGAGHDVITASVVSGDGQNYRGNSGNDTLNANGQTVNWLYSGSDNGNDVLTGNGAGTVKAIAQDSQVVFGIQNYNNGVDEFVGDAGKTLIRADAANNTLDFSQTVLTNIREVDGGAGHDVITASAVSGDGQNYRGNSGNDTLNANGQTVNWLYSGSDNGNDVLTGNGAGTVKAIAQDSQVVFGIQNYNNGVDEFVGDAGKTLIRADAANNTLDFSRTVLTNISTVDASAGHDTVYAATSTSGHVVYDGNSGTDTLVVTLNLAQAQNATLLAQLAALHPGASNGSVNAGGLEFDANNFENFQVRVQIGDSYLPLNASNVWFGTANHDSGGSFAPELSVPLDKTAQVNQAWTIFGLGGDDKITGGNKDDILVGGIGRDTMNGGNGSDTYLVGVGESPTTLGDNFADTGTAGYDRVLATANGTQIVINGGMSGIEEVNANGFTDVNLAGATGAHNTFNLASVKLVGIGEVQGGGSTSNDTFYTSNNSDAVGGQAYRGGGGSDTFNLGHQSTRLFVSAADNGGFDSFAGNVFGDAAVHTVVVQGDGTQVGIGTSYGGANTVDVIDALGATNTSLAGSSGAHNNWDLSTTELKGISVVDVGGGNDTVRTAVDADGPIIYRGGSGNDTLFVSLTAAQAANPAVLAAVAQLHADTGFGNGSVNAGGLNFSAEGFENFKVGIAVGDTYLPIDTSALQLGNADHNTLTASNPAKATTLFGFGGDDTITGGDKNDVIVGGAGNDTLNGGKGDDTFIITNETANYGDSIIGGDGNDRIVATANGVDINLRSLSGIEDISGAGFHDVRLVGNNAVHVTLDLSNTSLHGISEVYAGTANNTIYTSSDSDAVGGQAYRGGAGNDTFIFGNEDTRLLYSQADNGGYDSFQDNSSEATHTAIAETDDTVIGIAGTYGSANSVDVIDGNGHSNVTIVGGIVHNHWDFTDTNLFDIAGIYGGDGTSNDIIVGSKGNDTIYGLNGNDQLSGGLGNDTLNGGAGNDWLSGGLGRDTLTGGTGADTFAFGEHGPSNVDTILDYNAGEGDKIDLTGLLHSLNVTNNADVSSHIQLANDGANVKLQVDVGGSWSDVAVLQGYHTGANDVLVQFENQAHTLHQVA
ncbi:T1SS-143 repeat domain-containing protein [Nitrobacteraceae bacterium UC4446_H13]